MEMLVVISIIALLSSIILTSYIGVRKLARDSRRIADLRQMNSAIQFYINDNGHAPYLGTYNCQASNSSTNDCYATITQSGQWGELATELRPYLAQLPVDPCGEACNESRRYAAYYYKSPANLANYCGGCGLTESELNSMYSIFAEVMEVADTDYTSFFKGVPTFGYKTHNFGTSF